MKTPKILLISIICLCNVACAKTENIKNANNDYKDVNLQYNESDETLNEKYKELLFYFSSAIIKKSLKDEQNSWLKSRAEICGMQNLTQPKTSKQIECYISENRKRIKVFNFEIKHLHNIANKQLVAFDLQDNKLIPSFQSYCMCERNIPFIDLKINKFINRNACDRSTKGISVSHNIKKISATDEYIDFEMTNDLGSNYHVMFKPQQKISDTYLIVTGGDWGVIKDLNIPTYLSPNEKINEVRQICEGFEG